MYTHTFATHFTAELSSLQRDTYTGLIVELTWHCYSLKQLYGTVILAQRPVTNEFYLVSAHRRDGASWLVRHVDTIIEHSTKHFADTKSQGAFFEKDKPVGTTVDGVSEWEI